MILKFELNLLVEYCQVFVWASRYPVESIMFIMRIAFACLGDTKSKYPVIGLSWDIAERVVIT